jgi:hypothetical protein
MEPSGGERRVRRPGRRTLALLAGAALAAPAWTSGDLPLRMAVVATAVALLAYVIHRCSAAVDPDKHYLDMLSVACALRVDLDHVRVATVHRNHQRPMVTVTWYGARTTLLDADARTLATSLRNGLTTTYTMTLVVDDHVADLLWRDRSLGDVSIYAVTDLAAHPGGNLREHGVTVEQYDLAFESWTGSIPTHRIPQPWEP